MNKIIPSITDTLMHSGNSLTGFLAFLRRHFFNFIPLALCFGKRLFLLPKKARICYLLSVRQKLSSLLEWPRLSVCQTVPKTDTAKGKKTTATKTNKNAQTEDETRMPTAGPVSVFSGASPISQEIVANHLPVAVRLSVQDLGIPPSGLCWTMRIQPILLNRKPLSSNRHPLKT